MKIVEEHERSEPRPRPGHLHDPDDPKLSACTPNPATWCLKPLLSPVFAVCYLAGYAVCRIGDCLLPTFTDSAFGVPSVFSTKDSSRPYVSKVNTGRESLLVSFSTIFFFSVLLLSVTMEDDDGHRSS